MASELDTSSLKSLEKAFSERPLCQGAEVSGFCQQKWHDFGVLFFFSFFLNILYLFI